MKNTAIGLIAAIGILANSVPAVVNAGETDIAKMEDNYILWRSSSFNDHGMFEHEAGYFSYDVNGYFVSTNISSSENEEWYDSQLMFDEKNQLEIGVNIREHYAMIRTETDKYTEKAESLLNEFLGENNLFSYALKGNTFYIEYTGNDFDINLFNDVLDNMKEKFSQSGIKTKIYYPESIYRQRKLYVPYLTKYSSKHAVEGGSEIITEEIIQNYLNENELNCSIVKEETKYDTFYYVVPNENYNFDEHFELASKMYLDLGITPYMYNDGDNETSFHSPVGVGKVGDCNIDGKINIADAVLLERCLLVASEPTDWDLCDINGDRTINVFDYICLRKELTVISKQL